MTRALLGAAVNALEILAALLGLIKIILIVRRSIWNYPFGWRWCNLGLALRPAGRETIPVTPGCLLFSSCFSFMAGGTVARAGE